MACQGRVCTSGLGRLHSLYLSRDLWQAKRNAAESSLNRQSVLMQFLQPDLANPHVVVANFSSEEVRRCWLPDFAVQPLGLS